MKKINTLLLLVFPVVLMAQSVDFPDDNLQRGYYDRPYLRYEAEAGKCITNGNILPVSSIQTDIQSEASNMSATQLVAQNSYIQWTNTAEANGLTIRFSLPDGEDGLGTTGTLALYVNDAFAQNIEVNSYWAWQYFRYAMDTVYPDNAPDISIKFARMRFDESHILLDDKIPAGAIIKLVKADNNAIPYTIDFIELENVAAPLAFADIEYENKIQYNPETDGSLYYFILTHQGQTIYLAPGKYESVNRLTLNNNTKIIGAGMWYTEIYFSAPSDELATYSRRGIESAGSNVVVDGIYLNTINNQRYYNKDDSKQVGKGFMGSFGSNSVIKNVWVEHFECGAWIEQADALTMSHCRFRNNYADGINFSYGSHNSIFEHSSCRNNGDDDLATWSRSGKECYSNVFRYCTAENNWRASSLGFFGGKQNIAHHILIIDPMEAGFRVTSDFPGVSFSNDGYNEMHDISVYNAGVGAGNNGTTGDLWGNEQGAMHINASSQYDIRNFHIYNIDLYNSKNNAINIGCGSKFIRTTILQHINVHGAGKNGIWFNNAKGDAIYCDIVFENITNQNMNSIPSAFSFTENCEGAYIDEVIENEDVNIFSTKNNLTIVSKTTPYTLSLYDGLGKEIFFSKIQDNEFSIPLKTGFYIVMINNTSKKVVIN